MEPVPPSQKNRRALQQGPALSRLETWDDSKQDLSDATERHASDAEELIELIELRKTCHPTAPTIDSLKVTIATLKDELNKAKGNGRGLKATAAQVDDIGPCCGWVEATKFGGPDKWIQLRTELEGRRDEL
jgi:hypothetical protein